MQLLLLLLRSVEALVVPRLTLPDALRRLDAASDAQLVDAALGVCHALPTPTPLPASASELAELAAAFPFGDASDLKQHVFIHLE